MPAGRDGFIPPFMDLATLARHICCSDRAIEGWIALGLFPPPIKRLGGKRIWSWKEVEEHLARHPLTGDNPDQLADRIRRATKAAADEEDRRD